jgi:hypothetical protein
VKEVCGLSNIALGVPKEVTLSGDHQMVFTVDLLRGLPEGWVASCRVVGDAIAGIPFQGRMVQLRVPPHQTGELMLTLCLEETSSGRLREGAFRVPVGFKDSVVVYGEGAAVYQGEPTRTVDPRHEIEVELLESTRFLPVLLHDLLAREEVVPLGDGVDGLIRVFSLHAGPSLVVGRCYSSQLHASSRRRLRSLGAERVHWVSAWDDPQLNQIVAQLTYDAEGEQLVVKNLTDYSHTPQAVRVVRGGEEKEVLPGDSHHHPLRSGEWLHLEVGVGARRRQVVKIRFEEILVGNTLCPVLTTAGTRFPFPPQGADRRMVGYLGTWIALPRQVLEQLLETLEKQTLDISFLQEKVSLSLSFAPAHRAVVVNSNEDLARWLDLR